MATIASEKSIKVVGEITDFIIPLTEEEFLQLERNILSNGCRDPLTVWQKGRELILVDGHNRFRICRKHNLPFKIEKVNFDNLDEVKLWMVDNQMGRRNLTPDQLSYYRGLKYLSLKKKKGGYLNVLSKGQDASTSEMLSTLFSVSESTIKRDAKFAEGLNIVGRSNPKLKIKILVGEADVKKGDVQTLADAKNASKIVIKNEADLYNKAKIIRDEILDEVERKVRKIESDRVTAAQETMNALDPLFIKKEDRLRKIKGMIISAINKAINDKDTAAIKELKKLIDQLANELYES